MLERRVQVLRWVEASRRIACSAEPHPVEMKRDDRDSVIIHAFEV